MLRQLCFMCLPFIFGARKTKNVQLAEIYIKGTTLLLSVYWLLYYVTVFLLRKNSVSFLSMAYGAVLSLGLMRFIVIMYQSKPWQGMKQLKGRLRWYHMLVIILLGAQLVRLQFWMPYQIRDSLTYDYMVHFMVDTDLIFSFPDVRPYSATYQLTQIHPKFVTTPWYVFEASIAQIFHLNSLVITRTWIPVFVLVLTYAVLLFLARELFRNDEKKQCIFLAICALIYESRLILGEQSAYMLIWPSWGKSFTSSITCILLLAWILYIMRTGEDGIVNALWLLLFSFVGTGTTAATMMVIPVEMSVLCGIMFRNTKKRSMITMMVMAIVPCVFQFVVYTIYVNGYLTNWFIGAGV